MATYFEVLGVGRKASADEVERAYRYLAQKFDPNLHPDQADFVRDRFRVIQKAYEVLSNPELRRQYEAKLARPPEADWQPIPMNRDTGGIRFNADGSLDVAGTHIEPDAEVQELVAGAATIEKDAGVGGELRVRSKGRVHRFRYSRAKWYSFREGNGQPKNRQSETAQSPPPPPPKSPRFSDAPPDAPPEPQPSSGRRRKMLPYTLGFGALVIGLALAAGYFANRRMQPPTPPQFVEKSTPEPDQPASLPEQEEALQVPREVQASQQTPVLKPADRQRQALAKELIMEVKRRGDTALATVDAIKDELDEWEEQFPALLTNEDGRRLAASESNVRAYIALQSKPHPSRDDLLRLREQIVTLQEPLNEALAAGIVDFEVDSNLSYRLEIRKKEADDLRAPLRESRIALTNLLAVAPRTATSSKTLADAIQELQLEDARQEAEVLAKIERETRERAAEELAKAKQDLIKAEAEKEVALVEAEVERNRQRAQLEKEMAEAKSSKVQRAIQYFTTPGHAQPDGTRTNEPRPVSYSRLVASGILEQTPQGMRKLANFVAITGNDIRPRWQITPWTLGPPEIKRLNEVRDYLDRLGPALVELKMLDP